MADNESEADETQVEHKDTEEPRSFRDRVEELRQQKAKQGEADERSHEETIQERIGGCGPSGGMMGGGSPDGPPGAQKNSNEELIREIRKAYDELHDIRRGIERIGASLED